MAPDRLTLGASSPPMRTWKVIAAAAAASAFFFQRALWGREIFATRDILRVYYPLRQYWAERVREGHFPQWYPFDGLGQSFPGMLVSGAFHPTNLLYLALSPGTAMRWNVLLCFPVALLGMYFLARLYSVDAWAALFGATVFSFCGYLVGITNNLAYLMAAATLPWVFWAGLRVVQEPTLERGCALSVLLALVAFTGDTQSFVMACGLVLVMAAARPDRKRRIGVAAASVGFAGLLASIQLAPALAVSSVVAIARQPLSKVLIWSMHPLRLLDLVIGPLFHLDETSLGVEQVSGTLLSTGQTTLWVESVAVGMLPLLMAAVALVALRRSRGYAVHVAAAASLLFLVLGRYGGLYGLLFRVVPLWRPFRYPEKLLPFLLLLVSLGAALGCHALWESEPLRRRVATWAAALAGASGVLFGLEWGAHAFSNGLAKGLAPGLNAEVLLHLSSAFELGCLRNGLSLLLAAAVLRWSPSASRGGALLAGIAFLALFHANEPTYSVASAAVLEEPSPLGEWIQRNDRIGLGGFRVFWGVDRAAPIVRPERTPADTMARQTLAEMASATPALLGIEEANAYLPAATERVRSLVEDEELWFLHVMEAFGTRYVTVSQAFFARTKGARSNVADEDPEFGLFLLRDGRAFPRAYLSRAHAVASLDEARRALQSGTVDLRTETVVEGAGEQDGAPSGGELGTARLSRDEPERVDVSVDARAPALLVLGDAFYPGWTATLDGVSASILPANVAGRAVRVAAGHHEVEFRFEAPGLRLGAWLSAAAWLAVSAVALRALRRRRWSLSETSHAT